MKSKKLKIFVGFTLFVFILLLIATLVVSSSIKNIENHRDTRLDLYESTELWVIDDMRSYLTISDNQSLQSFEGSNHFSTDLRQRILSSQGYNASVYPSFSGVSFVDAQYSLEENNTFIVYLLADVTKQGVTKQMNFLVFISNGTIYNIVAY